VVKLNRIYTRTGDRGDTGLTTGERVRKYNLRVTAYGEVDETNACIGLVRQHTASDSILDAMLVRIQNDLFDLGADLSTPERGVKGFEPLRIVQNQVDRLEREIDQLNVDIAPLTSFVLPGGSPAAAALHQARTVCRRAERLAVELSDTANEDVSPQALMYLNRLSDLLFVMARWANDKGESDVLWKPGATRDEAAGQEKS
jgi:cob(I)alamin adenosyltransferase